MDERPSPLLKRAPAACAPIVGVGTLILDASKANLVRNGGFDNVEDVSVNNTGCGGDVVKTEGATGIPNWTSVKRFFNDTWSAASNSSNVTASFVNGNGYILHFVGQSILKQFEGSKYQRRHTINGRER